MFDAFLQGLLLVLQWPALGYLALGVFIGIWLGVIPGLGGIIGLVLLLPFTFGMDPVSAFALLLGMFAVTSTSDTISTIMLGVPGPGTQAILLDGHPLAKQGHAARAFGASFTVSAFGGLFGAMALALSIPVMRPLVLSFTSPETFMLGLLGLSMVASLSGSSIMKGLSMACLGLLISSIGFAQTVSIPRYWFEIDYLLDGLPLIPIVLGLFGLPELLELAVRNVSISRIPLEQTKGGSILDGVKDAIRHWWLATRCAAIGTYVGILPGVGGSIVDWLAYGHTVQSAKDKSQFGKGDIRGVIGPDVANNACKGGDLIPTVGFGIPGSLGAAILLGALVIQGLKPGPEMLSSKLHITFSMVWSIVLANIIASVVLIFTARHIAKLAFIPGQIIVPGALLFIFTGAWLGGASILDWVTLITMGVIGFVMKRGGWPRPPLVLAIILGDILENSLILSVRAHDGMGWITRPIVLVILAIIVFVVALAIRSYLKQPLDDADEAGEGRERNPLLSLPFASVLFVSFVLAAIESRNWSMAVGLFPMVATVAGAVFAFFVVLADVSRAKAAVRLAGGFGKAVAHASESALLGRASRFFLYLILIVLLTLLVGQKIALPIFIFLYLTTWARYRWEIAAGYAMIAWVILVGFYDRVMHLLWYNSYAESFLIDVIPSWFPRWFLI